MKDTLSPTVYKLLLIIRAEPDNWNLRRILADAYEDAEEDVLANGQRWQATNGKHLRYRPGSCPSSHHKINVWEWWSTQLNGYDDIPRRVLSVMTGHLGFPANLMKEWASPDAGEHALAVALWSLGIVIRGDQ